MIRTAFCAKCQADTLHQVGYDSEASNVFKLQCPCGESIRISGRATKPEIEMILADHRDHFKGMVEPTPVIADPHDLIVALFGEN